MLFYTQTHCFECTTHVLQLLQVAPAAQQLLVLF
jgi:hypothetical protein